MLGLIVRAQTGFWRAKNLLKKQDGQTTSEYLVIAGVVVAIVIGILALFRTQIQTAISTLGGKVNTGAGS